ncbi:MAG: peptide ABC transporter substrate-binding protein [Armatimonadetes bacterium]|nr:peptide ABC transporter substrate-binding protein [Armatimonadota bacterium]MDE2205184.1 peptide ABC transporter substrate-binding protein [Armatimonadota bacterium]
MAKRGTALTRRQALALITAGPLAAAGCSFRRSGTGSAASADVLRVALLAEPGTFDPAKVPDLVTAEMLSHVAEPLIRYTADNKPGACLAQGWEISTDRLVYTFHLRQGARFSNGDPLTANDVKASWERALSPKTIAPIAPNYLAGVVGVSDIVAGRSAHLAGVEALDSSTLRVTLDHPRSYFLGMVSYPTNFVLSSRSMAEAGNRIDQHTLCGTGPYTLQSYEPGVMVRLKANADYWGGPPRLRGIDMPVMLNPDTIINNFHANSIDMWNVQIPFSRYAQDEAAHRYPGEYHLEPMASIDYFVMHPKLQPVFADPRVRRAFAGAIDVDQILRVAYLGVALPPHGMVPDALAGGATPPPVIAYDPVAARRLLAQAGFAGGKGFPRVALVTLEDSPPFIQACQIAAAGLQANLGISVDLQVREAAQFWADQDNQTIPFYFTGWVADYPDLQDFLSALFVSHAPINRVGYANSAFDALCRKADGEPDGPNRVRLYARANAVLMQDVGVLPVAQEPRIVLARSNVHGWQINLCNYLPDTATYKTSS